MELMNSLFNMTRFTRADFSEIEIHSYGSLIKENDWTCLYIWILDNLLHFIDTGLELLTYWLNRFRLMKTNESASRFCLFLFDQRPNMAFWPFYFSFPFFWPSSVVQIIFGICRTSSWLTHEQITTALCLFQRVDLTLSDFVPRKKNRSSARAMASYKRRAMPNASWHMYSCEVQML